MKDQKKIADRYEIIKKIGEGAYGKVFLAKDLKTNVQVAIKKIKLGNVEEGIPISSIREISLLKELNHINVVKLMDVIHLENKIVLVFEYLEEDLKKLLKLNLNKGFEVARYKSLIYQLLQGIRYVHKLKIIHRDIKSENLLISDTNVLKIADFGLARGFGLPIKTFRNDVVSLWYRAPDILLGNEVYTTSVDLWSIGCIFGELVKGTILFHGYNEKEQLTKIFEILGTPDVKKVPMYEKLPGWKEEKWEVFPPKNLKEIVPNLDDNGIDLLKKLLEYDPEKRISAADALEHPFFKDLDEKTLNLYKK
jgi:cyclin-dependent kinase